MIFVNIALAAVRRLGGYTSVWLLCIREEGWHWDWGSNTRNRKRTAFRLLEGWTDWIWWLTGCGWGVRRGSRRGCSSVFWLNSRVVGGVLEDKDRRYIYMEIWICFEYAEFEMPETHILSFSHSSYPKETISWFSLPYIKWRKDWKESYKSCSMIPFTLCTRKLRPREVKRRSQGHTGLTPLTPQLPPRIH